MNRNSLYNWLSVNSSAAPLNPECFLFPLYFTGLSWLILMRKLLFDYKVIQFFKPETYLIVYLLSIMPIYGGELNEATDI